MTITNLNTLTWGSKPDSDHLIRGTMKLDRSLYPDLTLVRVVNPDHIGAPGVSGFSDLNNPTVTSYREEDPAYYFTTCKVVATLGDDFDLVEVEAAVVQTTGSPGIRDSYQVVYDTAATRNGRLNFFSSNLWYGLNQAQFKLEIHGDDFAGGILEVPIPTPQSTLGTGRSHRANQNHVTTRATVQAGGLLIHVFWDIEALSSQAGLMLNISNGSATPTGDVLFKKIYLRTPTEFSGITWSSQLQEKTMFPSLELLVSRFNAAEDPHIIPMRWERPFRVIIHQESDEPDLIGKSLAYADWSGGGYFPSDIGLPEPEGANLRASVINDYNAESEAIINGYNAGDALGDTNTDAREFVSTLWPARGSTYGGTTGEVGIHFYPGARWAQSKTWQGHHLHMIDQLRLRSRTGPNCIYDPASGDPIVPEDYLNGSGELQGKISNGHSDFEQSGGVIRDDPFNFWAINHRGKDVHRGWAFPTNYTSWVEQYSSVTCTDEAAYNPALYGNIDWQHYIRALRANQALAWLANDPLAILYNEVDATICRMSLWDGTAATDVNTFSVAATTADTPFNWGRGEAWRALAVNFAVPFARTNRDGTDGAWKAAARGWIDEFQGAVIKARCVNNGMIGATNNGKVAKDPPYGDNSNTQIHVWCTQAIEVCYLTRTLWEIGKVLGGADLDDIADKLRLFGIGMSVLAWPPTSGRRGFAKIFPICANSPTTNVGSPVAPYYTSPSNFATTPPGTLSVSTFDAWLMQPDQSGVTSAVIGILELARRHTTTSTSQITDMVLWHCQADDLTEALAFYSTLRDIAQPLANSPYENYVATLYALQSQASWS